MSHTHVFCRVHIIFSTKDRLPLLPGRLQPRLWRYMAGICRNIGAHPMAVGGHTDHAHLLVGLPPTVTLAACVQKIKANSSRWLRLEMGHGRFQWQEGYSAFSVSVSLVDKTTQYIRRQPEHHKKMDFTREISEILLKHEGAG